MREFAVFHAGSDTTNSLLLLLWRNSPTWARAASFSKSLDHTQLQTAVGKTPLDE
jgi:hypothetical protein